MKLAGVVILYNPPILTIDNIKSYCNEIDELYIIDNSTKNNQNQFQPIISNSVYYIHNGENKGIAYCINKIAEIVTAKGYNLLLTMDQDSYFNENDLIRYNHQVSVYPELQNTAMFGVNYSSINDSSDEYNKVNLLITSGSIINLNIMKILGGFDENLFIDEVDTEYCYRARLNEYQIVKCPQIKLNHELGEIKMGRSLISMKLSPRILHSPIRVYYMVRNHFYVINKLKAIPIEDRKEMKHRLFVLLKNNLIYNTERIKVINYIIKGYIDYKKNKMGKYG